MKKVLYLISFLLIFSCDVDEIYIDVYDPEQERIDSLNQRSTDKNLIFSYLDANSIVSYDSTNMGVFYSVIDTGDSLVYPDVNDIVSINIAGYYTNDSIFFTNDSIDLVIFDTNQQSLAESIGYFDPTKYYSPLVYTYNGLGSFFPVVSDHGYLAQLSDFKTALGMSLSKVSENGRVKILIPSGNAYGDSGNTNTPIIPENAVLIFDVHLIKIRK
jgi:hypothetical protein